MKQKTIIDEIDVSECIHIQNFENVLFVCEETGRKCDVSKNCYYKQLKRKEQECENLKSENFTFEELVKTQEEQIAGHNVIIDRFLIASGKSKDITQPEEFEEVFEDIEQTYSECEELKIQLKQVKYLYEVQDEKLIDELATENKIYKHALDEIEEMVRNYDDWDLLKDILNIINKAKEQ